MCYRAATVNASCQALGCRGYAVCSHVFERRIVSRTGQQTAQGASEVWSAAALTPLWIAYDRASPSGVKPHFKGAVRLSRSGTQSDPAGIERSINTNGTNNG